MHLFADVSAAPVPVLSSTFIRRKRHTLRLMADGRWVCSGGDRIGTRDRDRTLHFTGGGCDFSSTDYAAAVDHATLNGSCPPDMPRGTW